MFGDFGRRLLSTTSLKRHQVHGYRRIVDMMLERYGDLGEIQTEHLEPHERDALEKFKEFEKASNDTRKTGVPIFS